MAQGVGACAATVADLTAQRGSAACMSMALHRAAQQLDRFCCRPRQHRCATSWAACCPSPGRPRRRCACRGLTTLACPAPMPRWQPCRRPTSWNGPSHRVRPTRACAPADRADLHARLLAQLRSKRGTSHCSLRAATRSCPAGCMPPVWTSRSQPLAKEHVGQQSRFQGRSRLPAGGACACSAAACGSAACRYDWPRSRWPHQIDRTARAQAAPTSWRCPGCPTAWCTHCAWQRQATSARPRPTARAWWRSLRRCPSRLRASW